MAIMQASGDPGEERNLCSEDRLQLCLIQFCPGIWCVQLERHIDDITDIETFCLTDTATHFTPVTNVSQGGKYYNQVLHVKIQFKIHHDSFFNLTYSCSAFGLSLPIQSPESQEGTTGWGYPRISCYFFLSVVL